MLTIPAYYFPCTAFLLDDDEMFLENVALRLSKLIRCQYSTDPRVAAKFLRQYEQAQELLTPNTDEEIDERDGYVVNIDFSRYYHLPYHAKRFEQPNLLIIDYNMPQLTGVEFCRQLGETAVKRILLTGQADLDVAVQAFNEGVINRYVSKNTDMYLALKGYIEELQQLYFIDLTQKIMSVIMLQANYLIAPQFIELFKRVIQEHKIVEYYLLDAFGSYLMLDAQANSFCFMVKPAHELDRYADIARGNDAPHRVIQALHSKTKLPLFVTPIDHEQPVANWATYLHDAQKLELENETLYYAVVANFKNPDLDLKRIRSFKSYQESLE